MDTVTMTLADFLLARIAEDDAGWRSMPIGQTVGRAELWERLRDETQAKRRILSDETLTFGERHNGERSVMHERFLRILATVYADHPDYRDEWRP